MIEVLENYKLVEIVNVKNKTSSNQIKSQIPKEELKINLMKISMFESLFND